MTLDVNKPSDQELIEGLPAYIRENRVAINAVSGSGNVGATDLAVSAGATSLVVGTDVGLYGFEVIKISSAAAVVLATMLGGTEGQVKVFIFQDANIDLADGVKADGKFYLNHLPALTNYSPQQDDVLALANIGGDGALVYGYWKELYRAASVK
jgi:hypothetical protein